MSAVDDNATYELPSLLVLAYQACNRDQRKRYDGLRVMHVELRECCESILKIIKFNCQGGLFRPDGPRRSMFAKVKTDYRLINNMCETAAHYGHLGCMRLARALGVPWYTPTAWQKSACDEAADTGDMECLVYAHANGSPWSTWTCNFAAGAGNLECLRYLHANGCPWDDYTCTNAARYGQLECLAYAQQNGCPWDADTCSMAAFSGHLECLRYCRENGCPWDTFTCEMAACTGQLDCLVYARTNGCPWTENTCIVAAYYGHIDCLRYAWENGCEWDVDGYLSTFHGLKDPSCLRYALQIKYGGLAKTDATAGGSPDDVTPSE